MDEEMDSKQESPAKEAGFEEDLANIRQQIVDAKREISARTVLLQSLRGVEAYLVSKVSKT